MVRAGLGYLAAADAAQLPAATQAECLRELEQTTRSRPRRGPRSWRRSPPGRGTRGRGYSAVSWLMHRTGITRGAAVGTPPGPSGWPRTPGWWRRWPPGRCRSRRGGGSACGPASCRRSTGTRRTSSCWPPRPRAGAGGPGVAGRGDVRAGPRRPAGSGPGPGLRRPRLKLATTIGGAGVVHGDLTPECAAAVAAVLDALSAPAGKEDDRTRASGTTTRWPRRCAGCRGRPAAGAGRAAGQGLGAHLAGRPAAARRRLRPARAVDRAGPGPVGGAPRAASETGAATGPGWRGRRRGDRVRRGDGPDRHRRRQRGRAGGPGPALRGTGRRAAGRRADTRPGRRWSRR